MKLNQINLFTCSFEKKKKKKKEFRSIPKHFSTFVALTSAPATAAARYDAFLSFTFGIGTF